MYVTVFILNSLCIYLYPKFLYTQLLMFSRLHDDVALEKFKATQHDLTKNKLNNAKTKEKKFLQAKFSCGIFLTVLISFSISCYLSYIFRILFSVFLILFSPRLSFESLQYKIPTITSASQLVLAPLPIQPMSPQKLTEAQPFLP